MKSKETVYMKSTEIINPYPDFEQSWIMEEPHQLITVPACGLIVTKSPNGQVKFHDDEFPGLGADIGMRRKETDAQD